MTYTYACSACEHQFEATQRMSDAPLKECPECKEKELRRIFVPGSGGFQLKGKGWFNSGGY